LKGESGGEKKENYQGIQIEPGEEYKVYAYRSGSWRLGLLVV